MTLTNLLENKVVLVVGGTVGLGAGIARAAAREGASVVVTGRRPAPGEALVAELSELAGRSGRSGRSEQSGRSGRSGRSMGGASAAYIQGDLGDAADAVAMVEETIARHGRVDALVNSAGLTTRGTLVDTTPELFDDHVAVNLRGPFFTMQTAVKDMLRRGEGGTIVNIITMSQHGGQPFLAPYAASKAGLAGLTRNAAHAHRWDRIRINGLNIGWTQTEGEDAIQRRFHGAGDDWVEQANASLPMGRLGQVDEIADFVVFLLSERSGVVTGSVIDWDQTVRGALD